VGIHSAATNLALAWGACPDAPAVLIGDANAEGRDRKIQLGAAWEDGQFDAHHGEST
jgi:hypothetical protein